jgi:DUF438 domain-containing protein
MFISVQDYLKRITNSLEHIAAPHIEDDFARGQVLAAVFLLDNLADRVSYKEELITGEIEKCFAVIKKVTDAIKEKTGELPDELAKFLKENEDNGGGKDLKYRDLCDTMLSATIDLLFEKKNILDPKVATALSKAIMNYMAGMNMRDIGMLNISCSAKLIQAKD